MDNNPWKIDCIEAFLFFNCPECAFIAKEENFFQDHAKDNHPQSYVLFGGKNEKSVDYKTMNIQKCEPEDMEEDLLNDDQNPSLIENIEDFTGKYEELQLSDDDTTDPLAVGKVIKFSNNSNLINLEQTSGMVEGLEEKFNNLERNAEDTPVDEKEQKLLKINDETKSIHEGKKSLECSTCNKYFSKRRLLNRHIESVHEKKQFECSTCMKRFSRKDKLKLHIAHVHDKDEGKKNLECSSCNEFFYTSFLLNRHIESVHEKKKTFECTSCMKRFSRMYHLKIHIACVHIKKKEFKCTICDKGFSRKDKLFRHERVHDENKPHKKIYKLKNEDKKKVEGNESSTEIDKVQSILDHVTDPITVEPSKVTKHCSKIEQKYKGKQLIQDILVYDQKYNENLESQSGFGKNTKKIHEKSKMNLKMPDFAKAITYSQIEKKTKELPWCHICKINFNLEKELKDHFKSSHMEEKPYKCFICCISFTLKDKLKNHLRHVHEGNKPLQSQQCPFCDKKLSRKDKLNDHISAVHEKETSYQCDTCEIFFSNKQHLKRHIETVHDRKKPFKCSTCEKCFAQTHLLNRHIETVHEGKLFQCTICLKQFPRKDKLKKHIDERHKNTVET
jgi:KRAB domain-containing zinc finger protein